jgi:hypothetical protein
MTPVFVQALLAILAGVALFWLWRLASPSAHWLRFVVAAGFLGRATLGQALFWISWARLPIARSLQTGNGLWFFGDDAKLYFPAAVMTARNGLGAIYAFDHTAPARIFIQTLAVAVWLVGAVASTAVLLNLFFYLGTVAVITGWPVKDQRSRAAAAIAVTAVSLSPALVLWTLQPLKDTYFQFLFVSFIAACAAWQRAWAAPRQRGNRIAIAALLLVLMFGLASIRWYFGFALFLAASFFLLLTAFKTAGRKRAAVSAAVVMVLLLSRSLVIGSGVYLPPLFSVALNPITTFAAVRADPSFLFHHLEWARASFDAAGGHTMIRAGELPVVPLRRGERLLKGAAVVVLPSRIGEGLGIFHVGGGRGMMWFTEIDTIIFDAALLLALFSVAKRFRLALRDPLTWLTLLITLLIGIPLVYAVSNFGTLFRLREMIYIGLVLTPLAVATALSQDSALASTHGRGNKKAS